MPFCVFAVSIQYWNRFPVMPCIYLVQHSIIISIRQHNVKEHRIGRTVAAESLLGDIYAAGLLYLIQNKGQ